ncbi:MAG: hypothetical protein KDB94_08730 [Acidobacteria bacterium]|nr:hypothetical protein [Acidobacteriota bacterium]MCB9377197.1 hypothetical protein [Holophagales bacterium]
MRSNRTPSRPVWPAALALALTLAGLGALAPAHAQAPASAPAAPAPAAHALETPLVEIDRARPPVELEQPEGFQVRLFQDGRVYIGGQPSEAALAAMKALGVTAIVNLRTQREMDNRDAVPYDEQAKAAELGFEYVHLPIGGDDNPWRPEVVDGLADVLRRHPGPVLLHCTVAWRASYVWTAFLIRELGLPLDEALARGQAIALDESPLGDLLGRRVKLVYADSAP